MDASKLIFLKGISPSALCSKRSHWAWVASRLASHVQFSPKATKGVPRETGLAAPGKVQRLHESLQHLPAAADDDVLRLQLARFFQALAQQLSGTREKPMNKHPSVPRTVNKLDLQPCCRLFWPDPALAPANPRLFAWPGRCGVAGQLEALGDGHAHVGGCQGWGVVQAVTQHGRGRLTKSSGMGTRVQSLSLSLFIRVVNNGHPTWNPGKLKHGLKSAVPWWFIDPRPYVETGETP